MLQRQHPDLRVLFATNFSDACVKASRAVAQLADALSLDVTVVHATKSGTRHRDAREALERFFPDGQPLFRCRRVAIEARDPVAAVAALCDPTRFDLVVAPGSGRRGLANMFAGSFRARLLRKSAVPVWTAGSCLSAEDFGRPIRTVACLVDFDDRPETFLPQVTAFANHFGARVQALAVLPPIDDGTLAIVADSGVPLAAGRAVERIGEMFGGAAPAAIDVAVGGGGGVLTRMLQRSRADLLFVGPRRASGGTWRRRLSRELDRLPCPVICVGEPAALHGRAFHQAPAPAAPGVHTVPSRGVRLQPDRLAWSG